MHQHSLFGHLVSMFSSHPENMATEALHYILTSSAVARHAFIHYVAQTGIHVPDSLTFQTQVADADQAIPDLVGMNAERQQVLIVEAKFWASLTDHQPITYLQRLPAHTDGILLFLAPAIRFPTLWNELRTRCREQHLPLEDVPAPGGSDLKIVKVGSAHVLALTSWQAVLTYLLRTLETAGQHQTAADVQQLLGLCNRMDTVAFLPLHSEDLTDTIGVRIVQYCQIVDEVTSIAVAAGYASVSGLRATGGSAWYGRYMLIHTNGCFLHFSAPLWAQYRSTPLWLRVAGPNFRYSPAVRAALAPLEHADPPRLILTNNDELVIPITLPLRVERDTVVAAVAQQVKEVADLLQTIEIDS